MMFSRVRERLAQRRRAAESKKKLNAVLTPEEKEAARKRALRLEYEEAKEKRREAELKERIRQEKKTARRLKYKRFTEGLDRLGRQLASHRSRQRAKRGVERNPWREQGGSSPFGQEENKSPFRIK